ncbi:MAG: hypothetical protein KA746_11760 [Pyrinomonadaceae bacterium]|nr:hypothetical protein [Pyrinomonadaceae bacterium]MBP6211670.1 hypothetical protein [Pyrinomonadaceae bacterium]
MTRTIKIAVIAIVSVFAIFIFLDRPFSLVASGADIGPSISAPTGLTASDGDYSTKIGLHWDTMRGATLYRIYRNTTNNSGSATDVGTTPANYFFDATPTAGQSYYYWVRAENGATTSLLSTPDQGLRAITNITPPPPFLPLEPPPAPTGNPVTAAKAYLGKALFWDEQLSSTKTVSCGTCHQPAAGGSDPRSTVAGLRRVNPGPDNTFATADDIFGSPGVPQNNLDGTYSWNSLFGFREQVTGRKSPTYLNAGYSHVGLFWDGRATVQFRDPISNELLLDLNASLESQSAGPPMSSSEMAHTNRNWTQAAARIQASKPLALAYDIPTALNTWIGGRNYPALFEEAFGSPDVTAARIAMAIATHERTLFSDNTPFDREAQGVSAMTASEISGRNIFLDQQCANCHDGALLSNHSFHNIGVRPQAEDQGRRAVTNDPDDFGRFKTPNLRNIELRGPFMHNGRFATVEDVVDFYNRGGDFDASNIDHSLIRPLNLTGQEKADLAAFLKRPLTDLRVQNELPPFDRPKLFTESNRVPVVSGTGRTGTGGITPTVTAIEPPLVGNPSFAVGVTSGLGAAPAVLVINSTDPGVGATIPATGSFARVGVTLGGSGTGNGFGSVSLAIPNNPALVGQTFYGRWYVTDAGAANGFAVSQVFQFTVFGTATGPRTPFDFDGDIKTDISIFRPGPGEWWYLKSSTGGNAAAQFGSSSDNLTPADYTGDGKTDIAFFRPSTGFWYVLRSDDFSFYAFPFGSAGDNPVPADYDADGKSDPAIFRPSNSTWYISNSGGGTTISQFGTVGDLPVTADFDGDGRSDIGIFRPSLGQWWISRSSAGLLAVQFGQSGDKTVPGDFTGDGKADVAYFRPANGYWTILRSENMSFYAFPFGTNGDSPVPGDYDGDGKFDAAVFRSSSSTWYAQRSTAGTLIQQFGQAGDVAIPNTYVR